MIWVSPFKDKKVITITDAFQKVLDVPNRKPNKMRVRKGSYFYNRSIKSWIQDSVIAVYSTHNEGKYLEP